MCVFVYIWDEFARNTRHQARKVRSRVGGYAWYIRSRSILKNYGNPYQNPTASIKSYWELGSRVPPQFPGLYVMSCLPFSLILGIHLIKSQCHLAKKHHKAPKQQLIFDFDNHKYFLILRNMNNTIFLNANFAKLSSVNKFKMIIQNYC